MVELLFFLNAKTELLHAFMIDPNQHPCYGSSVLHLMLTAMNKSSEQSPNEIKLFDPVLGSAEVFDSTWRNPKVKLVGVASAIRIFAPAVHLLDNDSMTVMHLAAKFNYYSLTLVLNY